MRRVAASSSALLPRRNGTTPAKFVLGFLMVLCAMMVADAPAVAETPGAGPRMVVTELQGAATTLWAVDPADPRRREALGQVVHAEGWGLRAQASPDGRYVAYVTLPEGARDPDTEAELWALDVAAGAPRRLGTGLDLLGAPRWAPDGRMVVARRTVVAGARRSFELVGFDPGGAGEPVTLAVARDVDWAGAVGWVEGGLVYATVDEQGTSVHQAGAEPLWLTSGIARDFRVQSEGGAVAFVEAASGSGAPSTGIADLQSRTIDRGLLRRRSGAVIHSGDAANDRIVMHALSMGEPLGFAPDGSVSVLLVSEGDRYRPTGGYLAVVDAVVPAVRPVVFDGYAEFAGWLP